MFLMIKQHGFKEKNTMRTKRTMIRITKEDVDVHLFCTTLKFSLKLSLPQIRTCHTLPSWQLEALAYFCKSYQPRRSTQNSLQEHAAIASQAPSPAIPPDVPLPHLNTPALSIDGSAAGFGLNNPDDVFSGHTNSGASGSNCGYSGNRAT